MNKNSADLKQCFTNFIGIGVGDEATLSTPTPEVQNLSELRLRLNSPPQSHIYSSTMNTPWS